MGIHCACMRETNDESNDLTGQYIDEPLFVAPSSKKEVQQGQVRSEVNEHTVNEHTVNEHTVSERKASERNDRALFTVSTQLSLQSSARGFLLRKVMKEPISFHRSSRQSQAAQRISEELKNPENKYKKVKQNLYKKIAKHPLMRKANKTMGEINLEGALDGIPIDDKPAFLVENGVIYQGHWNVEGLPHGTGMEEYPDGTLYIGHFKDGMKQGIGRMIHPNENIYHGEFRDGLAHGKGAFLRNDDSIHEGGYKKDKMDGHGVENFKDGSRYEGNFRKNEKNGKGKFTWKDGSCYEGEFRHNDFNGKGEVNWANGRSYNGNWSNGKMHGTGVFKWPNGSRVYEGEYENGEKSGNGKLIYGNGKIYDGRWLAGKEHGIGDLTYNYKGKWITRAGEWENGTKIKWIKD